MKKLITKMTMAVVFSVAVMGNVVAQTAEEALASVKEQVTTTLADLNANKTAYQNDPAKLNAMIESKMMAYFDADFMARAVLGKKWKSASKQQQEDFVNEFKQMLLRSYSSQLLDYTESTVTYGKPGKVKRNRTDIDVTVTNPDGRSYPLTLSMVYRNNQWKGYDVSWEGLSAITSYRSSLAEEISQKGLQQVIDDIKQLNVGGQTKK